MNKFTAKQTTKTTNVQELCSSVSKNGVNPQIDWLQWNSNCQLLRVIEEFLVHRRVPLGFHAAWITEQQLLSSTAGEAELPWSIICLVMLDKGGCLING